MKKGIDNMKITQIFEFTPEEREHISFVAKFFREIAHDENITERLTPHFADNIADNLDWFLEEIDGESFYTIDVPHD